MSFLPTQNVIVQRFAIGLYNTVVGSTTMAQVNQQIANTSLNATLNSYFTLSFGSLPVSSVATMLVSNLGITGAAASSAVTYVVGRLNAVAPAVRGETIADILNLFLSLTTDPTYGAFATSFANKVNEADNYRGADNVAANESLPRTYTLTTNPDDIQGAPGDDTIHGTLREVATEQTVNPLDIINGGAGKDTLVLLNETAEAGLIPTTLRMSNVETVVVRSVGKTNIDLTHNGITGVETVRVAQGHGDATVKASATTNVVVDGVLGNVADIMVTGGKDATVVGRVVDTGVQVSGVVGAVKVTHGNTGAGNMQVNGGTDVTVETSGVTTGTVNVGATTAPTGAVVIRTVGAASTAGADSNLGDVTVKGGSSVRVEQTATSSAAAAAADATGATVFQGDVNITAGAATTSVTVTQTNSRAEVVAATGTPASVGVKQVDTVTFAALAVGGTATVGGLTFTAAKALTAAEVAAAFANLAAGATQGAAPSANGVYSGAFSGAYSTGAVTTTTNAAGVTTVTVAATAAAAAAAAAAIAVTGPTAAVTTAGVPAGVGSDAKTGVLGVVTGAVTITDNVGAAATIKSVNLEGYGATTLTNTSKLETLTLVSSGGAAAGDTNAAVTAATAATATLNVNNVKGAVTLTGATVLNVTSTSNDSAFALTAAAAETLAVSGDRALNLTGSTLGALKTVTATGSAALTLDASGATVTAVNASGSTGAMDIKVDGSKATYSGSAGADKVTLSASTVSKAVNLGAGNDTLILAAGTTAIATGGSLAGGDGTDTLVMEVADAATASATTAFGAGVTGFEVLSLGVAAGQTVNLANLGGIKNVVSAGGTTLTLTGVAAGSSLELTGAATTTTVTLADATGTADVFSTTLKVDAADVSFGTLAVAGVETVNITATDASAATLHKATLVLDDAAAKTVMISGNAHVDLTAASTVLTTVNASAATGALKFTTAVANATVTGGAGNDDLTATAQGATLMGGAGNDKLTASGQGVTLNGGAGNDTLTVMAGGNLSTLTGGAGADVFDVAVALTNVNSYASVTDFAVGDTIKMGLSTGFAASKITLAATAVFQDFANAAMANLAVDGVAWFQFGGNTYVVKDAGADSTTAFVNGEDFIVQLTGLVDLSAASFSITNGTITL